MSTMATNYNGWRLQQRYVQSGMYLICWQVGENSLWARGASSSWANDVKVCRAGVRTTCRREVHVVYGPRVSVVCGPRMNIVYGLGVCIVCGSRMYISYCYEVPNSDCSCNPLGDNYVCQLLHTRRNPSRKIRVTFNPQADCLWGLVSDLVILLSD